LRSARRIVAAIGIRRVRFNRRNQVAREFLQ
jgi:hypothetical protein